MLLKEYGFRPVYHNICIFKLNDKLRDLIKVCPDADKSSHAVCYGYIDAKKGLMLEVLCGGKQAPKYFYFKDTYEGERITIPASDLNEEHELTKENLEDGSFLKQCIGKFLKDTENKDAFSLLLAVMRSSSVVVPCDMGLSDEAAAIMEKLKKDGKSLDDRPCLC